jgi:coproporphyrinogen III oxidase
MVTNSAAVLPDIELHGRCDHIVIMVGRDSQEYKQVCDKYFFLIRR